jgi:hypothetical protein
LILSIYFSVAVIRAVGLLQTNHRRTGADPPGNAGSLVQQIEDRSFIGAAPVPVAADLKELVQDKREGWGASDAKARRRQRRYKTLLTQQLLKLGATAAGEAARDANA